MNKIDDMDNIYNNSLEYIKKLDYENAKINLYKCIENEYKLIITFPLLIKVLHNLNDSESYNIFKKYSDYMNNFDFIKKN